MKQHLLKYDNRNLFAGANPRQIEAITHESGPVMCLAGPGSGKTFVLTRHIRYLIQEKQIEPHHILVITFSKASAIEMQKRFIELMDGEYYPVRFGTFHSIFFHLLSRYEHYKSSDILTNSQKKKYLKSVLLQMNYQGKTDLEAIENMLQNISYIKNHSIELFSHIEKENPYFNEIYHRYESLLRQEHKLDFDDMMLLCHELLIKKPNILQEYKKETEYVLIDEYQDINSVQYELVKKIIAPEQNLFVVGDDDQSIYGFRGCNPQIMLAFKEEFPNGKIITFPINYRCTQAIVDVAECVISHNENRYEKHFRAAKDTDTPVHIKAFDNKEAEYEKLIYELKERRKTEPFSLNYIACLFRTNLDSSYLAERLLKENIPYQMREKPYNPYEHFIAKDFLHYLNLGFGNLSLEHFLPIMNRPLRYLSRDAVNINKNVVDLGEIRQFYIEKEYMQQYIQKFEYDIRRMQKMDIFATINYVRKGIGYDDFLQKYARESEEKSEEYLKIADDIQKRMAEFASLNDLQSHIDNYHEQISNLRINDCSTKKEGVHIMTYHASKGLEFNTVYLPDCNEGIIPYRKSITKAEIEEERRLFYVAMTRAKEELNIFYVDGNNNNRHLVSRFVKEAKRL